MPIRPWILVLACTLTLAAQVKSFKPDTTHSVIGFRAATVLFDVPGRFDRYQADIAGDPADPAGAKVRVEIDATSIDTSNAKRDKHLQSADFFDAAQYPKIVFTGSSVRRQGDQVVVKGTLTMHGVSKELEIPFRAAEGMNGAGTHPWSYRATVPLDRLDYGIGGKDIAAKISLCRNVDLDLLLVGFFD